MGTRVVWLGLLAGCGRLGDHVAPDALDTAATIDAPTCTTDSDCGPCQICTGTCQSQPIQGLALGHRSTCFLGLGGSRWCVGEGNGVGVTPGTVGFPSRIPGDDGWTLLAPGWMNGVGLRNGQVWGWSQTAAPALASTDGAWADVRDDLDNVTYVRADGTATCGLPLTGTWTSLDPGDGRQCGIQAGALYCWGSDASNALGQGVELDGTVVAAPTQVGTDTDWKDVSISNVLACARKLDNTIWCWGAANSTGTNGVDTMGVPTQISPDTDWVTLEVHWDHGCARKPSGKVWCWGFDDWGLDVIPGTNEVPTPTLLDGTWDDFLLGGHHYCGLTGGSWYCWGWNAAGQLGVGDAVTRQTPTVPLCTMAPP